MQLITPTTKNLADYADILDVQEIANSTNSSALSWLLANGFDYDSAKNYAEIIDDKSSTSIESVQKSLADVFDLESLTPDESAVLSGIVQEFFA